MTTVTSSSPGLGRVRRADLPFVDVERFGAVGDGVTDCTDALWAAIIALRANSVEVLDNIGGETITAYSSGVVQFGRGIFVISADAIDIVNDHGLTLRGCGSRRATNAIRGATTLKISGTSAGFGIKCNSGGSRSLLIEDMDVCYADENFTGDVLDSINSPGLTLNRVFLGTFGITAGTRKQTARSLIRATYDEFHKFKDCVFDGAVDGWWSDDTRALLANPFGGFNVTFDNCVFYDFTGDMIRHDGNRTRDTVAIIQCAFNPISVDCARAVDLNNVDGLNILGSEFTPSTTAKATTEWLRLVNVTGTVNGAAFGSLSKAGTIGGNLGLFGNRFAGTDGLTLTGGRIVAKVGEFSTGTSGYTLAPTEAMVVELGPDVFKAPITNSYYIPSDSASLGGKVNYDRAADGSSAKFSNESQRISILNVDAKNFTEPTTSISLSIRDTGRRILATGSANQTFELPVPIAGCEISITKVSAYDLIINASAGKSIWAGVGAVKTTMSTAAANVGASVTFKAYENVGWIITAISGTWTI